MHRASNIHVHLAAIFASFSMLTATVWAADVFQITPSEINLQGNFARTQVVITRLDLASDAAGKVKLSDLSEDLTSAATFASSDPKIFSVDSSGLVTAVSDGTANLTVTAGGASREVAVHVSGVVDRPDIQFLSHVSPVLSKLGCNQGACHASQHGKGGFVLSVFGFDPDKDRDMLARDRDQRRIDLIEPEASLFLQKPTMQVAHGGGKRLTKGSVDYDMLVAWIKRGAPGPRKDSPKVSKLTVWPNQRLGSVGMQQQLRVEATYSTGEVRDVTAWARFDTMDDGVVEVSSSGLAKAVGQGQAPLMVRFEGQAALAVFVVPFGPPAQLVGWSNHSFVDELAAQKFRELGIEPSPVCDDATFIRRVFLDCIGTLPTVEETLAFLQSQEPNKRDKLVDRLLGLTGDPNLDVYNEHYAAYWTLKWSDLIRNSSDSLGEQGMWAMHNWIRDSFRQNKPFDKFVRELVMGKGSIYSNGPANYFRINKNSLELAEATSQIFLGIRMECAKCHHHPFEKYSQEDYYALAAFFSRVNVKRSEEFGLFGSEQVVFVKSDGEVRHPRTGKVMPPTTLDGETADDPLDRRLPLANWLTSPKNEYFAKSVVNRYVSYLLGSGLVEPVDDLRSTNPPSNTELMNALAEEFAGQGFNLKLLMKRILTSRVYQLDSQPTANNAADNRFFSHFLVKRIPAEPLLDAIDRVTSSPTKFQNLPRGTRAIELPDAEYPDYFLNTFAKPRRASVCECERSPDESLSQALHTLNGDLLANKIADGKGRIAGLIKDNKTPDEIVDQLYLATLCRHPSAAELEAARNHLKDNANPREYYEDLMWALINSKHFLFIH
jgi:hypothetical protein